jgi:hypothetical protein
MGEEREGFWKVLEGFWVVFEGFFGILGFWQVTVM